MLIVSIQLKVQMLCFAHVCSENKLMKTISNVLKLLQGMNYLKFTKSWGSLDLQ